MWKLIFKVGKKKKRYLKDIQKVDTLPDPDFTFINGKLYSREDICLEIYSKGLLYYHNIIQWPQQSSQEGIFFSSVIKKLRQI